MDGTLLDSEKLWDVALRELSLRLGGPMTEATRHAVIGASSPIALATIFDALGLDRAPGGARRGQGLDVHPRRRSVRRRRDRGGRALTMHCATVRDGGLRSALVTNTERVLADRALGHARPESLRPLGVRRRGSAPANRSRTRTCGARNCSDSIRRSASPSRIRRPVRRPRRPRVASCSSFRARSRCRTARGGCSGRVSMVLSDSDLARRVGAAERVHVSRYSGFPWLFRKSCCSTSSRRSPTRKRYGCGSTPSPSRNNLTGPDPRLASTASTRRSAATSTTSSGTCRERAATSRSGRRHQVVGRTR